MSTPQTYFATCAPGLEPLLHAEATALKLGKVERQVGGIRFQGAPAEMMRANLWLRTAGRILMRLERFEAHGSDALYKHAYEIEWERWIKRGGTLRVDAQTKDSELDHSRFVEQRIKDAVVDRLTGKGWPRPEVVGEDADLRIHAHIYRNRVRLSLDSSGAGLRKRGWREAQGVAPLSETLAAGLLLYSGWQGKAPLIDPFCGSGTLLVEAALFASNTAPGLFRDRFAFMTWPNYEERIWKKERASAEAARKPLGKTRLVGLDNHGERIEEARQNLASAGFEGQADLSVGDARAWAGKPGWNAQILTNPPYGIRIGEERKMMELYAQWSKNLTAVATGYQCAVIVPEDLAPALGWTGAKQTSIKNGALECVMLRTQL